MQQILTFGRSPLYSVDASALIDFKDFYPSAVFPTVWDFVADLADARRMLIPEAVKDECQDDELVELIDDHPGMLIDFGAFQEHLAALMAEAEPNGLLLVDPSSTQNAADPHVIALALAVELRDTADLRAANPATPDCVVISHERRRNPGSRLAKIPDVCDFYRLSHIRWLELLRRESFSA